MLQLYFKQGEFWQAVERARGRLGREGKIGTAHHGGQNLSVVFVMDNLDWSELGNKVRASIFKEAAELKKQVVPSGLRFPEPGVRSLEPFG